MPSLSFACIKQRFHSGPPPPTGLSSFSNVITLRRPSGRMLLPHQPQTATKGSVGQIPHLQNNNSLPSVQFCACQEAALPTVCAATNKTVRANNLKTKNVSVSFAKNVRQKPFNSATRSSAALQISEMTSSRARKVAAVTEVLGSLKGFSFLTVPSYAHLRIKIDPLVCYLLPSHAQ